MQNDENGGVIMTILFKCDKVIRSMKNKIVEKRGKEKYEKEKVSGIVISCRNDRTDS
ncbi:hypothetical protein LEA_08765, partial [human gut metagenome]